MGVGSVTETVGLTTGTRGPCWQGSRAWGGNPCLLGCILYIYNFKELAYMVVEIGNPQINRVGLQAQVGVTVQVQKQSAGTIPSS